MKKLFVCFLVTMFSLHLAKADQCALLPKNVADNAYHLLKNAGSYIDFCAPCMDKEPVTKHVNNQINPATPGFRADLGLWYLHNFVFFIATQT